MREKRRERKKDRESVCVSVCVCVYGREGESGSEYRLFSFREHYIFNSKAENGFLQSTFHYTFTYDIFSLSSNHLYFVERIIMETPTNRISRILNSYKSKSDKSKVGTT